jgi:hypothetical protein
LNFYRPVLALDVVGWITHPNSQHRVNRFEKHSVTVRLKITKRLSIRQQSAGTDTENEAAIEHVVEHRNLRRGCDRMRVWQVNRAGAKLDAFRAVDQARNEHCARRDVFRAVGSVFADKALGEAQFVREHKGLSILAE